MYGQHHRKRLSLSKLIPAKLHYVPFEAGVTAIAEMKSGSVQAISGAGNPPTTAAIGSGTGVTVVMGWGFEELRPDPGDAGHGGGGR